MKIIKNAIVTQLGAYYESGGLIEGTQRIAQNHTSQYWQQANLDLKLAFKNELDTYEIHSAMYVGRIPTHLGHFLMEGLPRLCDIPHYPDINYIGYITNGILPEHVKTMNRSDVHWVLNSLDYNKEFIEIQENYAYLVKNLYVPELPYHLSHSCKEPERMSCLIQTLLEEAKKDYHGLYNKGIKPKLYLHRYETMEDVNIINDETMEYSNPYETFAQQILKVSMADELYGIAGSNTHLSMFAKYNANTYWKPRGTYHDTMRNQIICDFIKTFNKH